MPITTPKRFSLRGHAYNIFTYYLFHYEEGYVDITQVVKYVIRLDLSTSFAGKNNARKTLPPFQIQYHHRCT
jgi:hypothetical protein